MLFAGAGGREQLRDPGVILYERKSQGGLFEGTLRIDLAPAPISSSAMAVCPCATAPMSAPRLGVVRVDGDHHHLERYCRSRDERFDQAPPLAEVADFYQRYRRGYPSAVVDSLVDTFGLTSDDVVVDLGCGTGQLALPMAGRVGAVVGVDPEPDMLVRARQAAAEHGAGNLTWMLGADSDITVLAGLLGDRALGAVTISQALHWMDHDRLFHALPPLLRSGGGVVVVTNGSPLWLQETAWSRALRDCLQQWLGKTLTAQCGTDQASQRRYRDSLAASGFEAREATFDYTAELTLDQIVGSLLSAFSVDQLPAAAQRSQLAEHVRRAIQPHLPVSEHVQVRVLAGTTG